VKLWHVGVPPSGPMDSLHHRLANALVGNPSDAAALEFGLTGPTLRFHCDCLVALTGVTSPSALTHPRHQAALQAFGSPSCYTCNSPSRREVTNED
jgi:allophanate hydrolase subunit 2